MSKLALVYMMLCTLSFAVMHVLVKTFADFHFFQVAFFRSIGTLAICLAICLMNPKLSLKGNNNSLLLVRGVVGTISLVTFFASIQLMPLGAAVSLRYLAPIFGIVVSVLFLKERIRYIQIPFIALAFIGVLIIKGTDSRINLMGFILVMISAFSGGLVYFILRKINKTESPLTVVLYFSGIATLLSGLLMIPFWVTPSGLSFWIGLMLLGVLGFFGQFFMTKAFQAEVVNKVAPLKYIEAVFALLFGWWLFAESYSWVTLMGICLVLTGVVLNTVVKKKA